jgi:hypothetical protein
LISATALSTLCRYTQIQDIKKEDMEAFFDYLRKRAFNEGYAAYKDNQQRHAPARMGTYAGNWVEGYDQAALDGYRAPKASQDSEIT